MAYNPFEELMADIVVPDENFDEFQDATAIIHPVEPLGLMV